MSRQEVRRVVLAYRVHSREVVFLQMEVPSLDPCRRSGLGVVEDRLDRFAISVHVKCSP